MTISIRDIILLVLIFAILYLLFSSEQEHFTDDEILNTINEEINNRYSTNFTNMRGLNNLLTDIFTKTNPNDVVNINQTNTKLYDFINDEIIINNNLQIIGDTTVNSDVNITNNYILPGEDFKINLKNNINVKGGSVKINPGKFNDIFPKGTVILFYIGNGDYNIPFGWIPCDGNYYDIILADSNRWGKDPTTSEYSKFYKLSNTQPAVGNNLVRNLDLANTWEYSKFNVSQIYGMHFTGYTKTLGGYNGPNYKDTPNPNVYPYPTGLNEYKRLYGIQNDFDVQKEGPMLMNYYYYLSSRGKDAYQYDYNKPIVQKKIFKTINNRNYIYIRKIV
jgi:hypothetical protein